MAPFSSQNSSPWDSLSTSFILQMPSMYRGGPVAAAPLHPLETFELGRCGAVSDSAARVFQETFVRRQEHDALCIRVHTREFGVAADYEEVLP
jgi:hypothetical protein